MFKWVNINIVGCYSWWIKRFFHRIVLSKTTSAILGERKCGDHLCNEVCNNNNTEINKIIYIFYKYS